MPTYLVKINCEKIIVADDENQAEEKFFEEIESEPQQTVVSYICDNVEIEEVCPYCEEELKPKMFSADKTDLIEHKVCEECGFGTPDSL